MAHHRTRVYSGAYYPSPGFTGDNRYNLETLLLNMVFYLQQEDEI